MLKHKKIRESGLFKSFGYIYRVSNVILTRKEKESLVIKLAEEGKTTRYIAEKAHVSLKDIGTILRRYTGEEEESPYREKGLSMCTRAFRLFKEGKNLVDTAIALDMETDEVLSLYSDYLRLLNLQKLMTLYRGMGDEDFIMLEYLYNQIKREGLATKRDIYRIIEQAGELRNLDQALIETASDIGRLNSVKFQLERDVDELTRRIDHYDALLLERSQQARQF
jgi:hypothetical protein